MRRCLETGCPALTSRTRCEYHRLQRQRQRQAERDPAEVRFYGSAAWQALRAEVMADAGYRCEVPGCPRPAASAGHIRPRRLYPELALDRRNLRAECRRHQELSKHREPGSPLPV